MGFMPKQFLTVYDFIKYSTFVILRLVSANWLRRLLIYLFGVSSFPGRSLCGWEDDTRKKISVLSLKTCLVTISLIQFAN